MRAARVGIGFLIGALGCAEIIAACRTEPHSSARPPLVSQFEIELAVPQPAAIDLLLVVDDSPSMADEQERLRRELPRMLAVLLGGQRRPQGHYGSPIDLHVGVVSADLGAAGLALPDCSDIGGAGLLTSSGCEPSTPSFLSYRRAVEVQPPLVGPVGDDEQALIDHASCRGELSASGCGLSQPLEAALRALDATREGGPNAGLLRLAQGYELSHVVVLVITDGDDCSLKTPEGLAGATSGEEAQARCTQQPDAVYGVEHYVDALRALRPGYEATVSFIAIAGVPQDLVEGISSAPYDRILSDSRMQPTLAADGTSLMPACQTSTSTATPSRRLVEVAQAFDRNGSSVRSICSEDWSNALADFVPNYDIGCISAPHFERDADGRVACEVVWTLPKKGIAPPETPTRCADDPALSPDSAPPRSDATGERCTLRQLAVRGLPTAPELEPGRGWFLYDFSGPAYDSSCTCLGRGPTCNAVVFTPDAQPPAGVSARLRCLRTLLE
jgi:hypothetical protein